MVIKQRRALLARVSEADLRLLRVFVAIAEANGLAAAELSLNISRSVISRYLKTLEERLGVSLCKRGPAGFLLTEEGGIVLAATRRLIGQIEAFRSEIAEINNELRGELQLAVFDKFVTNPACRLSQTIAGFVALAPGVKINLHVASSASIEQGLLDGRYHLAVQPFHRASDSYTSLKLFDESMHLYCSAQHPFASEDPLADSALRRADFVGLAFHSQNMETYWRLGLEPVARATDQEASLGLILSARFVGFLPEHYARAFEESGQIVRLAHELFRYQCEWHATFRRSPPPGRVTEAFLQHLIAMHTNL